MLYMYYKVKDFGSLNKGMKFLVYKVYWILLRCKLNDCFYLNYWFENLGWYNWILFI